MSSLAAKVATASIALAVTTTTVNAGTVVRAFKGGQCLQAKVTLQTGMNKTFRFGNRSAKVHVPRKLKGNPKGAQVAFGGMAGVVTALQSATKADSVQFEMKCPKYFKGEPNPWYKFCGTGKVTRAGKRVSNAFGQSCKPVRNLNSIYRTFSESNGARKTSANTRLRTSGTTQRACKDNKGCFQWRLDVK